MRQTTKNLEKNLEHHAFRTYNRVQQAKKGLIQKKRESAENKGEIATNYDKRIKENPYRPKLVRMRSAVRICPAAPQNNLETAMVSRFFLFCVCGEQMTETATKTATGHKKNAGKSPGIAL